MQVHHPAVDDGDLVLRTNLDWDQDLEPHRVDEAAGRYEFHITTTEPFVYFKAMIRAPGGQERWARGPDQLATTSSSRILDVFPSFDESPARVSEAQQITTEHGTWSYRVFVPAGYDGNELHRYPVLYMNDGQNLFAPHHISAGTAWGVEETLTRLHEMTSIEHVLVVAVVPSDRMIDYTRKGDTAYGRILAEHLKPRIDEDYRTLSAAEHTAIMGSSLGGVSALSVAWNHPDQFGMAGCMSASFGYDTDLRERVLRDRKPEIRVYLDSGWPRDNFEVTRDMRARLARAGFVEGIDLLYFAFPGDRHSETDWGDRSHVAYQFFFGHRPYARSRSGQFAADEATGQESSRT